MEQRGVDQTALIEIPDQYGGRLVGSAANAGQV